MKKNTTDDKKLEKIKVKITSNEKSQNQSENLKKVNDALLIEEDNKIDTRVPIPEPKPQELVQSPIIFKQSNINGQNTIDKNTLTYRTDDIFSNEVETKKYDFDVYKHLKQNLKFKEKQCQDGLTKDSYYCLECKMSVCPKCPLYKIHNGHPLVQKYQYYNCNDELLEEKFKEINTIFKENPNFLDYRIVKEELKQNIIDNISFLINELTQIKETKMKEIDSMFEGADNCVEILKKKVEIIKKEIKNFILKQKKFFCLDLNENPNINQINPEANEVLQNLKEGTSSGMIQTNKDVFNSTFLIFYDLLKNTEYINNEIKYFIYNIKQNREKYINDFNRQKDIIYQEIKKLGLAFDGNFNYQYLTTEYYQIIYDKISKYNEKIEEMKKHVFEKVNQKGGFEEVLKESKVFGTELNQQFEHILNNQLIDEDEAKTLKSAMTKSFKKRKSMNFSKAPSLGPRTTRRELGSIKTGEESLFPPIPEKIYNSIEEIKLDKELLQDYFAYEAFHLISQNFRIKKKKEASNFGDDFDEETDLAKPIQNKNEIQIYDKKSRTMIRKVVKFDKNKHKYIYFLNGCRSVLIKDKLYILGGVDKENNVSKIAYVYYIKTNELKPMPEMLKPHAYHSAQFLDYYKSIVVIGGQNTTSCELYDMSTGLWRELPDLKIPRAHTVLYLDKITHILYSFFGILGKIAEKNNNYTDILECLEFRKLALGWNKVDYHNKSEMNFRNGISQILPLNPEMLLVYGGSTMREFVKKSAIFMLPKQEMCKIDNRMFNEIREASKKSKKLSKILSSTE